MADRVIESRPKTEAYIGERGHVVLKQEDWSDNEPHIITLTKEEAPRVIQWLQELLEERLSTPDSEFEPAPKS